MSTVQLPTDLPAISDARLPQTYEVAKEALAQCCSIDECQDWADRAAALASYARQANDEDLQVMMDRIRARAIRRCGELLKTFKSNGGRPQKTADGSVQSFFSQKAAARDAGLSERREKTAVLVANIPESDFETAIESPHPPTVTALAEQGKKIKPLTDIGDRDPEEFALSTQGQGNLRRFAAFCEQTDPAIVARGALDHEISDIKNHIAIVDRWLDKLVVRLGR